MFHGRKGERYRAYHEGMEDQFGALGLVLNCITRWNTVQLPELGGTRRMLRDPDAGDED